MAEEGERGALTLLWTVSICILVVFGIVSLAAIDATDGGSVGFGIGGVFVGALMATVWQMRKRRMLRVPAPSDLTVMMDRLQMLEQDQQRMAELEERVDFAERLLARAQADALLPDDRRDGRHP